MQTNQISETDIHKINTIFKHLKHRKPANRKELADWLSVYLDLKIPDKAVVPGNSSPMDYLWHVYSADDNDSFINGDSIVWANRGGGKTQISAAATLLDLVFKAGCQIRILAGSFEQASRMYDYLVSFVNKSFEDDLDGNITKTGFKLKNGSAVEVLTQSSRSVRGTHVHKLRCDEVEMFDREVFAAAQYVTKSNKGIKAALEICSTMHRPYGLMQEVVENAQQRGAKIFKWSIWEVMQKCTREDCSQCPLQPDCGGKARNSAGYMTINDVISQLKRSSRSSWEAEMLCEKPMRDNLVFPEFNRHVNVKPLEIRRDLPVYRAIDFGYVNPFVCLWIQVDEAGIVRVFDEYHRSRRTVAENGQAILDQTPCRETEVAATYCDPAGKQSNDITGTNSIKELRKLGIKVKCRKSLIAGGLEKIREKLKTADSTPKLFIDPKCQNLIKAFECYHYPEETGQESCELPVKDGVSDHSIDALRYFFVNYASKANITFIRRY